MTAFKASEVSKVQEEIMESEVVVVTSDLEEIGDLKVNSSFLAVIFLCGEVTRINKARYLTCNHMCYELKIDCLYTSVLT